MKIKKKNKVFIIAEAGVNHNGDLKKALRLAKIAKEAGADAVKFQLFDVNEQISPIAQNANYQRQGTNKTNMLDMAKDYEFAWNNHIKIKNYCRKLNIEYLSSCCDKKAIDFLINKLKSNIIKISSGEITNYDLIRHANKKNKLIILSTGMATFEEIKQATKFIKNKKKLVLLHCVSNYPAKSTDQNMSIIHNLKKKFKCKIGFSDHTLDIEPAIMSVALGAKYIEKHFTINKSFPGPDHSMSLNPKELKRFIEKIRLAETIMGNPEKNKISYKENLIKKVARRGVISKKNILKGERLTLSNTAIKRPLKGIDAKFFSKILGKKINKKIKINTPIRWEMLLINDKKKK
tara:strand:+ start:703 stop:1746 length:1044 start_codon:yes stop_codon:yes gene_type:complete